MQKRTDKRICLPGFTIWILLILILPFSGCGLFKKPEPPRVLTPQTASSQTLGYSVKSRPIECYTIGSGPEVLLVLGAIHGNEPASQTLALALLQDLQKSRFNPDNQTIHILPLCNPDGLERNTRFNASGIDLNRNFPAGNRVNNDRNGHEGLTEPESRILYDLIVSTKPARILSIHQPYGCIDYDGPADELAQKMGACCPLPVRRVGARPGSLGSWAGVTMNIPIITLELTADDSRLSLPQLWAKYSMSVRAFIEGP